VHKHSVSDLIGLGSATPVNGGVPVYNSGTGTWTITVPSSATSPVVTPNAPTIASITSTAYFVTDQINAATSVTVTITDPTTNMDGTAYYGTSFYAIRWRYEDKNLTTAAGTSSATNPSAWTVVQSLVGSNVITFYNVKPATTISVQAMVLDKYNNPSGWTVTSSASTYIDPVAPGQPTSPTLVSKLGGILVAWDGNIVSGASTAPQPNDYVYTDIHIGTSSAFTPTAATKVGRLVRAGSYLVLRDGSGNLLTNGSTYYLTLISYDAVLQPSVASTPVAATVSSLPSTDIGLNSIAGAQIADLSVGKLTAGNFTAINRISTGGSIRALTSGSYAIVKIDGTSSPWTVTVTGTHYFTSGQTVTISGSSTTANNIELLVGSIGTPSGGQSSFTTTTPLVAQPSSQATQGTVTGLQDDFGQRVIFDADGIRAYNATGQTFRLDTAGNLVLNTSGSLTGARIVLNTVGMTAYDASNQPTFQIDSAGNASFNGKIKGGTVEGTSTVVGGKIVTGASPGARVEITPLGLTAYNASNSSIFDISTTKSTITGGDFASGNINGTKITGSAIAGSFFTTGSTLVYDAINGWSSSGARIEMDGSSGPNANTLLINGITNASFEQYSGSLIFSSVTATAAPNPSTLKTILRSPASSLTTQAAITLTGEGSGNLYLTASEANPGTTNGDQVWAASPYIKLQTTQGLQAWYFGPWMRSGFTSPNTAAAGPAAEIKRSDNYTGIMNSYGYYLMMQDINSATTFIGAGYNGSVILRPHANTLGVAINAATDFYPEANNGSNLGRSANKWTAVYAVNGTIQTSDATLKTLHGSTHSVGLGIDFVRKLRPVAYTWTDTPNDRMHTGFIAQDVKKLLDENHQDWFGWNQGADDDQSHQSLSYTEFIAPIVAAIQDVDTRLSTLETRQTRSKK
jgi:hypothetical protein